MPPKDAQPQEDKKKEEGKLNPEFTNLAWKLEDKAIEKSHVGDKLKLTADCSQMGSMKSVNMKIYEKDTTTPDDFIEEIKGKVIGGNKVEAAWEMKYVEDNDDEDSEQEMREKGYTLPEYYFTIETVNGKHKSDKSGILKTQDYIAIKMDGAANEKYEVYNIKGEQVAAGNLNAKGYAKIENLNVFKTTIVFPDLS